MECRPSGDSTTLSHPIAGKGCAFALFAWLSLLQTAALDPQDYVVRLSAEVQASPPQIKLVWPADPAARDYVIYRRQGQGEFWGRPIVTLPAPAESFVDTNVAVGTAYEYQVEERTTHFPWPSGDLTDWKTAYGYILAGIEAPLVEDRGGVVLVVDEGVAGELEPELARLEQDLIGDGWKVIRHDVVRTADVREIREMIRQDYQADPEGVKAVLLFGRIPVPYSGDLNPDEHVNHRGAWPADLYYGDMDGEWTDATVVDTGAEDPRNHNVVGDVKFDQSFVPGSVELQVGRVDLSDLPSFLPRTEAELLRNYLNKDHAYRHKQLVVERRGLIRDNFGEIEFDAPAISGWRNFSPFFSPANIHVIPAGSFFEVLQDQSFLWVYACGGGNYSNLDGVGTSRDFAVYQPKAVFTMLHGSYFGDWDTPDNLLRAPLASDGYVLTCSWAGLPHWYLHHMGLGETIGFSTKVTQNNASGLYKSHVNEGAGQVHVALMGDPTLRMHPVAPPRNLRARVEKGVVLEWESSGERAARYHVYRADTPSGPFVRLTEEPVEALSYTDASSTGEHASIYMVRTIKLESSSSGTYYNASQGVFVSAEGSEEPSEPAGSVTIQFEENRRVRIRFPGVVGRRFGIETSTNLVVWERVADGESESPDPIEYVDEDFQSALNRFYRVVWE